jgi:hypothetical protein
VGADPPWRPRFLRITEQAVGVVDLLRAKESRLGARGAPAALPPLPLFPPLRRRPPFPPSRIVDGELEDSSLRACLKLPAREEQGQRSPRWRREVEGQLQRRQRVRGFIASGAPRAPCAGGARPVEPPAVAGSGGAAAASTTSLRTHRFGPTSRSSGGAGPPRGAPVAQAARVHLRGRARSVGRVGPCGCRHSCIPPKLLSIWRRRENEGGSPVDCSRGFSFISQ